MATFTISNGIDGITGALKKTTEQGVNHITVTKKKHFHDPLTGEETGTGPNEIFQQNKRDYDKKPLTPGEKKQRGKWQQACCDVQSIIHDKSHPRFMELYNRWRAQLSAPEPYKQFPAFVRTFSSVSSRKEQQKGWPIDHPFVETLSGLSNKYVKDYQAIVRFIDDNIPSLNGFG